MDKHIRCISCRFARQDKKASEYSVKHCAKCDLREDCEVCRGCKGRDGCKARRNPKHTQSCERRFDTICSQQTLNWKAYECTNPDSEYHRALLNVTPSGDRQLRITWGGCADGERRRGV